MSSVVNETLALAALFQACTQIHRVARTGYVDPYATAAVIRGLIITNPQSCEDIYPSNQLLVGYRQLAASFSSQAGDKSAETIEITKDAFKVMGLELTIERNNAIFDKLGRDIDSLRTSILGRYPDYESGKPEIVLSQDCLHDFSELYQSLISPNFPRLMIYGEETYLSRVENQEMIRSLLLSGIRSCVLWRQLGGRRRYLFFRRKAIVQQARNAAGTNHS
ncbi:MAG: lysogenization regulator HflD [Candidatus Anaerobiospirillum merdipullorum]|uniref:Lysogenization regulator HflD n=1 Tax=Candidatus Anaerobiospirillum merdipullorum TaxID=2838450 RepID=A0A9E2NSL2_9GAMM|nr:lysogenization regulator HflD [Candidatus Anaerobiospirillum merdipullorum]